MSDKKYWPFHDIQFFRCTCISLLSNRTFDDVALDDVEHTLSLVLYTNYLKTIHMLF